MVPKGFFLSTASAGIKKPGRQDMALVYSEQEAVLAATFTRNRVKAAPVELDARKARSGRGRAIVVNSGNANACTGHQGMSDAVETAELAASTLGIPERSVYVCSTGVIGVRMPMKKIKQGVKSLAGSLGKASLSQVAGAMMTTDSFPKFLSLKFRAGSKAGTVSGVCKGAGMIAPDMATMLCFILTDVAVDRSALRTALTEAVKESFNSITVDGECSTNDTVIAMANGALGNRPIAQGSASFGRFRDVLGELAHELADMIVKDGEGATRVAEIEVRGARTDGQARKGAFAIANSLLVKTALHGADPNWGRIMSSLGSAGIYMSQESTDIYIGKIKVVSGGLSTGRESLAASELRKAEVNVRVELGQGKSSAKVRTCDLSEEYVRINAEYTT